ncbi:COMM domain-containing protein 10 [Hyposmocoma kahamanoa]|uniref:COMM domain-containing protein 10 n=1 Tax=Hyposmocoma kahamanoa TaxID=1477025 RepID=UPI000E6D9D70|nr:COMM domain-containing protein 10 [Hyposmocoma kahamanoa]
MEWIKASPSLQKGIVIVNKLEDTKFEQLLRRIVGKIKLQDTEIFTQEERQKLEKIFKVDEDSLLLAIKTVVYLFKRMLKFILMPVDLKNDLDKIGLGNNKAEVIVKVWSNETREILEELGSDRIDKYGENLNLSWKLNAELSSDYRKKYKVPKVYLSVNGENRETEIEMTHPELYSVFLQLESIQNELDNIM